MVKLTQSNSGIAINLWVNYEQNGIMPLIFIFSNSTHIVGNRIVVMIIHGETIEKFEWIYWTCSDKLDLICIDSDWFTLFGHLFWSDIMTECLQCYA